MGMAPDATPYVHAYVKGWLLTLLTLGIYSPFRMNQLHRTITENTMIGNWKLQYDGKDSDVAGIFFKGLFLSILTLGIYFFWARAELLRYYASHTIVGQARGHLDLNGGDLFMLALMNLVLIPITLGLAIPWVALMNLRLMIGKFSLEGFIDVENLLQSQLKSTPAVSDGIAEIFDVGAGV